MTAQPQSNNNNSGDDSSNNVADSFSTCSHQALFSAFYMHQPSGSPQPSQDVGPNMIFILQMRPLKPRERITCQGPSVAELDVAPGHLGPEPSLLTTHHVDCQSKFEL